MEIYVVIGTIVLLAAAVFWLRDYLLMALFELFSGKGFMTIAACLVVGVAIFNNVGRTEWMTTAMATALVVAMCVVAFIGLALSEKYATADMVKKQHAREELRRNGVRVEGTIRSTERTGVRINRNPEVRIIVDFKAPDGRPQHLNIVRIVDVMDVPKAQPGKKVTLLYDPKNPEHGEMQFGAATTGAGGGAAFGAGAGAAAPAGAQADVSGTGATMDCPLWLFGTEGAEQWVYPPRNAKTPLVLIDITDPFEDASGSPRSRIIDSAAFMLAEYLWAVTDLSASSVVLISLEQRKVIDPFNEMFSYSELLPFLNFLDYNPIVCWGAAAKDVEKQGIQLKVRIPEGFPQGGSERMLGGPLPELKTMLADFCFQKQLCARTPCPAWYRFPEPAQLADYGLLLEALQLMIVADKKNEFIRPLDPEYTVDATTMALDWAKRSAQAQDQLQIMAVTMAHYTQRAGHLPEALRSRAVETIRRVTERDHPLYRLSPHLLAQLGERMEAMTRRSALQAQADPVYAQWLAKTDDPTD